MMKTLKNILKGNSWQAWFAKIVMAVIAYSFLKSLFWIIFN